MGIQFPINALQGQQYTPPGIPITWQFDSGRNAWRVVRGGTPWTDITGKPTTFPPDPHQHPISDVTNLQNALNGKQDLSSLGLPNGYAPVDSSGHIPPQFMPPGTFTGDWTDISNKPATFPPSAHTHPVAEISDSGSTGQQVVRSQTQADARAAIGAIGINDNARVTVKKGDALVGVRRAINLIEGTNVSMVVVDDPANEEVDITINSPGGGTGGGGSALIVSEVKPASPFANDVWLDVATGIEFVYYNDGDTSQWIEALPYLVAMPGTFTKFNFPAAPTDGQLYNPIPGATWKWSTARGVWFAQQTVADSYTKAQSDANFVDIVGDVMTGPLSVVTPPTAPTHAASKAYVDSAIALAAPIYVSDTPPAGAADRSLWWESDSGNLYIRYNDGNTTQWVLAAPVPDVATFATYAYVDAGDAAAVAAVNAKAVRYDAAQALTAPQQQQGRQNIYAAPFDAMAYGGLQINGGFDVSQEKGTSGTTVNGYFCDGWKLNLTISGALVITAAQATSALFPGFSYCASATVQTAQASLAAADQCYLQNYIEGLRVARLAWGTANAQPITIAFWSAHHRTGVYSVGLRNGANDRSYVAAYTQVAADVPQYNVVTIPGDTTGTWPTDNTIGLRVSFAIAMGTTATALAANTWQAGNYLAAPGQINGVAATSDIFRLTGVTVHPGNEAPSAARSPYIMRPYDQELATCQRYYQKSWNYGTAISSWPGGTDQLIFGHLSGNFATTVQLFPKRAVPTVTIYDGGANPNVVSAYTTGWINGGAISVLTPKDKQFLIQSAVASATFTNFGFVADARL